MDLVALKTELDTDPLGRGYSAMTDEQAADSLNAPVRDVDRVEFSGGMLAACITPADWTALSNGGKEAVKLYCAAGPMPMTSNLKAVLAGLFGAGTQTRTNLIALMKRGGSRAEELGLGRVTPSNVADARRL